LSDNSASVPHALQIPIELTVLASCGLNSEASYHIAIWTTKPNAEYSKKRQREREKLLSTVSPAVAGQCVT
jgi:hypothetical protein